MQLVVTGYRADGTSVDLTRVCTFDVSSTAADVSSARVTATGVVSPKHNGRATISVRFEKLQATTQVVIENFHKPDPIGFRYETLAALTKQGCNAGSCHGSPRGRGGFSLSLLAYAPAIDEEALIRDGLGRRTNLQDPDASLLLKKPMLRVTHVGGKRLRKSDTAFEILRQWIYEGAKPDTDNAPTCVGIDVYPQAPQQLDIDQRSIDPESKSQPKRGRDQQLAILASFSDGSTRDVTRIATFTTSHKTIATVDANGIVTGQRRGQAAISIRYLDHLESVYFTVVEPVAGFEWKQSPANNELDRLVNAKLKQLKYLPSAISTDEVFIRRIHLDLVGVLPTAIEVREFLADHVEDKRSKVIDRLLATRSFARFWAQKQADLMRINPKFLPNGRSEQFAEWIVEAHHTNVPFDQFVRNILTSAGNTRRVAPANYFYAIESNEHLTETTAQVFMGSRIGCAKCHNHPFENWTQNDYYSIGAVFARVKKKGDEIVIDQAGETRHPTTGVVLRPWGFPKAADPRTDIDRRVPFVAWLTAKDNRLFARVEVNRIWSHLFGRGIVDPVDDFRSSNPPANVALLDWLAKQFVDCNFDRKQIIRLICNSQTYQRSSSSNASNELDEELFSHALPRLLSAEQMLDAISGVCGFVRPLIEIDANENKTRTELEKLLKQIANDQDRWERKLTDKFGSQPVSSAPWQRIGPFGARSFDEAYNKKHIAEPDPQLDATHRGNLKWQQQLDWEDGVAISLGKKTQADYLYRTIQSTVPATANVEFGCAGGYKLWINAELVAESKEIRPAKRGDKKHTIKLNAGVNTLLLKIAHSGGGSALIFDLKNESGSAVPTAAIASEILAIVKTERANRSAEQTRQLVQWKQDQLPLVKLFRKKLADSPERKKYATQRLLPNPDDPFLRAFGQPKRESPCACERSNEPTLDQALQLLNGRSVLDRVNGSVSKYSKLSEQKAVEELYITALSRLPRTTEKEVAMKYLDQHQNEREQALRDLVWAVINTQEFLLQH